VTEQERLARLAAKTTSLRVMAWTVAEYIEDCAEEVLRRKRAGTW
jgi:hypothetical protein